MNEPLLKLRKIYSVQKQKVIYTGTFVGYTRDDGGYINFVVLGDVTQKSRYKRNEKIKNDAIFSPYDTFYDLEEIRENGKKARQAMEKRTLDMVLKRLVNEHFEW